MGLTQGDLCLCGYGYAEKLLANCELLVVMMICILEKMRHPGDCLQGLIGVSLSHRGSTYGFYHLFEGDDDLVSPNPGWRPAVFNALLPIHYCKVGTFIC